MLEDGGLSNYNQYISVEVSAPMWNSDGGVINTTLGGGYRMYRIVTKLKENPDYAIQVHRRYNDLKWLIQAFQADNPTCIIPPIPA